MGGVHDFTLYLRIFFCFSPIPLSLSQSLTLFLHIIRRYCLCRYAWGWCWVETVQSPMYAFIKLLGKEIDHHTKKIEEKSVQN